MGQQQMMYVAIAILLVEIANKIHCLPPQQSPHSTCNEHCLNGCDDVSGVCNDCEGGWYGDLCEHSCDEHCVICTRTNGDCIECESGWYGDLCELPCDTNCLSCDRSNGQCQKCKATRWGQECTKQCQGNCRSCDLDTGECRSCIDGYYGLNCTDTCGNCWKQTCGRISGECVYECEEGWFGATCKEKCLNNCSVCSDQNTCRICHPGFAGEKCDIPCPSVCQECTYDAISKLLSCTVCAENLKLPEKDCICSDEYCLSFSMENNEKSCSECKNGTVLYSGTCCPCSHCSGGISSCDNKLGCKFGCEPGYYSTESGCDLPCTSEHCILCELTRGNVKICTLCEDGWYPYREGCNTCSENCAGANHTCNNETGVCVHGCLSGWHRSHCDSKCNETCVICDNYQGICNSCEIGFWGIQCENRCPENCQLCNITNGACIICEQGFLGDNCTDSCQNCIDELCFNDPGVCDRGCKDGWFGVLCDKKCPQNCLNCDTNETCSECVFGWSGIRCDRKCPYRCTECIFNTTSDNMLCTICAADFQIEHKSCTCTKTKCIAETENACNKCANGWFPYMDTCCPCSQCDWDSDKCVQIGKCQDSCDSNLNISITGCSTECNTPHCDWCEVHGGLNEETCISCSKGWYPEGQRCKRCSNHCAGTSGLCDNVNGHCKAGCQVGWHGLFCDSRCAESCQICDENEGMCNECKVGLWGDSCENECQKGCKECDVERNDCIGDISQVCNRTSGYCIQGCKAGRFGMLCDTHCNRCKDGVCDQNSGQCLSGCESGWKGLYCDVSSTGGFEPIMAPLVGGAVAMGVVIIVILVAFVCFVRKQKFTASMKIHTHHHHHHKTSHSH